MHLLLLCEVERGVGREERGEREREREKRREEKRREKEEGGKRFCVRYWNRVNRQVLTCWIR